MRLVLPLSLLLTVLHSFWHVWGASIPFEVVHPSVNLNSLNRRDALLNVSNNANAEYISNITIAGTTVRVLLDTGSSDLWVSFSGTPPQTNDLGKSVTLSYAVGSATGNVQSATVQVGPYTVQNQAFLLVQNTDTFSASIHQQGYDGLFGLGPNKGSVIYKKLHGHTGDSVLTNIFGQYSSSSATDYITLLLSRNADPMQQFTGQFTINEVVPAFQNITSQPKLDLQTVNRLLASDQHWQALTDVNGIIGPDGNPIVIKSIVPKAPKGQLVAVFDSGYTFSQIPRSVSDAIYGRVQGAWYDQNSQLWTVPCGQYLNLSVSFGGVSYPVHPFDLVDDSFGYTRPDGTSACIGTFQPITSAFSILGQYDMILGMSFLRNAYSLFNFGDLAGTDSDPYIQLVSITDPALAKQDFINIRLGGTDSTSDSTWALLPPSQEQHSPVPPEEKKKEEQEKILSRWPYIFLGCFAIILASVGFCIYRCCRRRRRTPATKAVQIKTLAQPNPFSSEPASTTYLPLGEPTILAGGVYQANGGKFTDSQYSVDSTYRGQSEVHYPPTVQYQQEPKSPTKFMHSFEEEQYPPPGIQYPPSPSQYPPSSAGQHPSLPPPQYTH